MESLVSSTSRSQYPNILFPHYVGLVWPTFLCKSCFFSGGSCKCGGLIPQKRVENGIVVEPHSIPFQVKLRTPSEICGGSLISPNFVLTGLFSNYWKQFCYLCLSWKPTDTNNLDKLYKITEMLLEVGRYPIQALKVYQKWVIIPFRSWTRGFQSWPTYQRETWGSRFSFPATMTCSS